MRKAHIPSILRASKNLLRKAIFFTPLAGLWALSRLFYKLESHYLNEKSSPPWHDIRVIAFLNHTSLFEPIFIGAVPISSVWQMCDKILVPGADITLNRPIVGRLFKLIFPRLVSITRKRDSSWTGFMQRVSDDSIVVMAAEGRMMRKDGLDKFGRRMTIRGGIADVLSEVRTGHILLACSGGLHHVHHPGQKIFRVFQKVKISFELLEIKTLLAQANFDSSDAATFKKNLLRILEQKKRESLIQLAARNSPQ